MGADESEGHHAIEVHLDRLLSERGMPVTELASRVGVTNVNLSVLKNGRAKAIRFTTLTRIGEVLGCQPGDLLTYRPEQPTDQTWENRGSVRLTFRPTPRPGRAAPPATAATAEPTAETGHLPGRTRPLRHPGRPSRPAV